MIRFYLNGNYVELMSVAPDITILQYLRTHLKQTDVKEGCASGDCGACTLVVAQIGKQGVEYSSLNSCISYLADLDGKWLITPKALAQPKLSLSAQGVFAPKREHMAESNLHPVQQAMVVHHGSQCGFCTPGFVMSMFALYKQAQARIKREEVAHTLDHDSLAVELGGNLCRCTGYRPIFDAGLAALASPEADQFDVIEQQVFDHLASVKQHGVIPSLEHQGRCFFVPETLDQLHALRLMYPKAQLVAGATDFALASTLTYKDFDCLIATRGIRTLKHVEVHDSYISIGAAATYQMVEDRLKSAIPSVVGLFERIGSSQIRNQGTLGGNVMSGSPIGDTLPLLMCLDAELILERAAEPHPRRRSVPINNFYTGYKTNLLEPLETLVAIEFAQPSSTVFMRTYKVSKRLDDDISAVCLSILLECENQHVSKIRIAFGGMAATAKRVIDAEQVLIGQPWTETSIHVAQAVIDQQLSPMSDARATDAYRKQVAKNLLMRAFLESRGGEEAADHASLIPIAPPPTSSGVQYASLSDYLAEGCKDA